MMTNINKKNQKFKLPMNFFILSKAELIELGEQNEINIKKG